MVAMNVWPTDAADGSVANEARWRKMGRLWAPTAPQNSAALAPSLAGTNLTVKAGAAWVDGHFCELLSDQVLTVTANGLAVVRFDPAANTAQLLYLDGVSVPSQSPTGTYEMPIAKITGSALTDARPWRGGFIGTANSGSYQPPASGTAYDIPATTISFAAIAGHYYHCTGWAGISNGVGTVNTLTLALVYNGSVVQSGVATAPAGSYAQAVTNHILSGVSGATTVNLRVTISTGPGSIYDARLIVVDLSQPA